MVPIISNPLLGDEQMCKPGNEQVVTQDTNSEMTWEWELTGRPWHLWFCNVTRQVSQIGLAEDTFTENSSRKMDWGRSKDRETSRSYQEGPRSGDEVQCFCFQPLGPWPGSVSPEAGLATRYQEETTHQLRDGYHVQDQEKHQCQDFLF